MLKKQKRIPRWKKLVIGAIAASVVVAGVAIKQYPYFVGEEVDQIVDGDTFFLKNRQPIRLYGQNAPALEYCFGQDAKKALSSLIAGKRVIIREPLSDGRGRILALVYVDNILVNEVMIRGGFAVYRQGGSEQKNLKEANEYARQNKVGIYSELCTQKEPPDKMCVIKGNYDDQRKIKHYLMPSCEFYKQVIVAKYQGDQWFCTEEEARKAGFEKSEFCK